MSEIIMPMRTIKVQIWITDDRDILRTKRVKAGDVFGVSDVQWERSLQCCAHEAERL